MTNDRSKVTTAGSISKTKTKTRKIENNENHHNVNHNDSWVIPPPRKGWTRKTSTTPSTKTPLLAHRRNNGSSKRSLRSTTTDEDNLSSAALLFGVSSLNGNRKKSAIDLEESEIIDNDMRPEGLAGFFFGFMYEEPYNDSFEYDDEESSTTQSIWNPLNVALFVAYTLTTAATTVPILLVPTIGQEFFSDSTEASAFTSRATSSAVLGTACGKFLNGPVGDVLGARRTSVIYAFLLSLSIVFLGVAGDAESAALACFFVEFFQSVQWPCILVILASHYGPHNHTMYEGGIYVNSIASRFGSLLAIPIFSVVLRRTHWRVVCLLGAWSAMIGCSVAYLFLVDSPTRTNDPQNGLHPNLLRQLSFSDLRSKPVRAGWVLFQVIRTLVVSNLLPSLKHVLKSGTFWVVALAHTGSSMVRTSERILGTYYHDTSGGFLSESRASSFVVVAAFGTILGLLVMGNMFTQSKGRQRKWLVSRLYMVTIAACYLLAILAIPSVRYLIDAPGLVLCLQVAASFTMAFGIAVMFYHIPGLVGSAFGKNKGLFSAYTDGVAYGVASLVWKVVANAVENGNSEGGGWTYGWAAVALLIILCAILMIEFMEHYFVRASGRGHGAYETIIFA